MFVLKSFQNEFIYKFFFPLQRTQEIEQEQRPTALEIIEKLSPKLAHLERIQAIQKTTQHSSKSGALISQRLTDVSGSIVRRGSSISKNLNDVSGEIVRRGSSMTRNLKRGISKRFRRLSLGSFKFSEQKSAAQYSSNLNSGAIISQSAAADVFAGGSVRRGSSLTSSFKKGISKRIRRLSIG